MNRRLLVAASFAALVASASAQSLLRDLNPARGSNGSLAVYEGVVAQGVLYFPGNRWDTGTELWRSDGTVAGTRLVRDLGLGAVLGNVQSLATNGSLVFFAGYGQINRSDGTEAGTYAIGAYAQPEAPPTAAGANVVWAVRNGSSSELWGSDGTSIVPTLLLSATNLGDPVSSGARAYFAAQDPANGWELWYTDGTPAGTVMIDAVFGQSGIDPTNLCSDGAGGVWFSGYQPSTGQELWHSDGTFAGTRLVADVRPGSAGSTPNNLCVLGTRVFFAAWGTAGEELWVSDGTLAGTRLVLDINPGTADSSPESLCAVPSLGRVVFSATEPTAGREPWVTDGTAGGTVRLGDLNPGNANSNDGYNLRPAWLGGVLWFTAATPSLGRELYRTDGTPAGTALVADLAPGPVDGDPRPLGDAGGTLLFSVYSPSSGVELWKLVPPATVPTMLGDFHPGRPEGSFASYTTPLQTHAAGLDGRQHFAAFHPSRGVEPHVHDGTPAGTVLVGEVIAGTAGRSRLLCATSTHVYYETTNDFSGSNPRLVAVPRSGPPVVLRSGAVLGFAVLRDRLVFGQQGTDSEPMVTDGTVAGTVRIADVRPGTASSLPGPFVAMGGRVWFFADNGVVGRELWVTDGTAAGTSLAVDCVPGASGLSPVLLLGGTSRLFFRASGALWSSDGTPAGTLQLPAVPYFFDGVMLGDVMVLAAGRQLWRSDGSVAGTVIVTVSDASNGEPIRDLCVARGLVFCSMERLGTGPQLWRTDGTAPGTYSVLTLHPSAQAAAPRIAPAGLGHVACALTNTTAGTELWISDGTVAGTAMLVDAEPGSAPSNPVFAYGDTVAGGRFTWWADTVAEGLEPWSAPLASFGGSDFDRYGIGCPGSRGVPHIVGDGLPILGSPRLAYQLQNALPGSFALLLLGFQRTTGAGACLVQNSGEVLVGLATDALGRAEHAFAVPAVASLVGLTISGQFVVLDPLGGALGIASGTAGLEALIGR